MWSHGTRDDGHETGRALSNGARDATRSSRSQKLSTRQRRSEPPAPRRSRQMRRVLPKAKATRTWLGEEQKPHSSLSRAEAGRHEFQPTKSEPDRPRSVRTRSRSPSTGSMRRPRSRRREAKDRPVNQIRMRAWASPLTPPSTRRSTRQLQLQSTERESHATRRTPSRFP